MKMPLSKFACIVAFFALFTCFHQASVQAFGVPGVPGVKTAQDGEAGRHYQLALSALQNGDLEAAVNDLNKAADLAPRNALIQYDLGVVESQLGRVESALNHLRTARDLGLRTDQLAAELEAIPLGQTATGELFMFNGKWSNTDRQTRGIARVEIRTVGKQLRLHVFGHCGPNECDWGEVDARAYGPSVAANLRNSTRAVMAQFETNFARRMMVARPEGTNRLVIETFTAFTDSSGRTDYQSVDTMERAVASER
jgi:hypothetical protein